MKITFGCIIIHENKILLVREKSKKSRHLEKWNFLSGTTRKEETNLEYAISREVKEESGLEVEIKGIVEIYRCITPKDTSLYFVIGCKALSDKIHTYDPDIIDIKFFDLDYFYKLGNKMLVDKKMHETVQKFLDGKYIDLIKVFRFD